MKKRNILLLVLLLSSCNSNVSPSINTTASTNDNQVFLSKYTNTLRDTNESLGWPTMNSTGNQKALIVPVKFSDGPEWTSSMLNNLETIFFGESKNTNWESVKSFFNKSSYGKLNITGEVYNQVIEVNDRRSTYANNYDKNDDKYDPGTYIGDIFYKNASYDYNKLCEYDQDGDGYLDAVIFVYSNSYSQNINAWWAWCYCTDNNPNKNCPTVNNYMWLSYDFMLNSYEGDNAPTGIDGHTFIHEMGHILGLDDYYCYDYDKAWNCAGELDMQSYNVGDHNIYSKFSLGWVDPIWITESTTVKLKTSSLYSEAILINDNWNKTIFDEYLLIEYYTPIGNNEQDSKYNFDSRDLMYNDSGLRIYHVDARMIKLDSNGKFISYLNTQEEMVDVLSSSMYTGYIGASNSKSYSYLSTNTDTNRLLHLIDSGANNTLKNGLSGKDKYGTYVNRNSTIWKTGSTFTPTEDFFINGDNKFNNGSTIGYTITVGAIENDSITINITKN